MLAEQRRQYWIDKHAHDRRTSSRPSNAYCWGGGQVSVYEVAPQVYRLSYAGPVSGECFDNLRTYAVGATRGARALIIDVSAVLSTSSPVPIPPAQCLMTLVGGVIICRPDQKSRYDAYAVTLLASGVIRLVFLDSEREVARESALLLAYV